MNRVFVVFLSLLIACGPSEEEIQSQIDEAVEEALQEVSSTSTSTTSTSISTTSTSTSTTTTTSTSTTTTTSTSTTTTTIYVDNEPPTWPDKTVTIVNLNPTYFEVQWKPASDNTNVAGYRFYLDNIFKGEYIRNNDNNSIFLDGLTGGTTYTLEIIAYDDETNQSIDNPTLTITTTTPTTTSTTTTTLLYTSDDERIKYVNYTVALGATSNVTVNFVCETPEYSDPKQEVVGDAYPINKTFPDVSPRVILEYNPPDSYNFANDGFNLVSVSINGSNISAVFTPISQEIYDSKGGMGWHQWAIVYDCEWFVRQYP